MHRKMIARIGIVVMALAIVGVSVASSASPESEAATPAVTSTTMTTGPTTTTTTIDYAAVQRLIDAKNREHFFNVLKLQEAIEAQEAQEAAEAEQARQAAAQRERERQEALEAQQQATTTTQPPPPTTQAQPTPGPEQGSGRCGGDLPPCYVMNRESGGDIRIWNGGCYAPVGWTGSSPCGSSSASGKWQFVRGSWAGYGGYVNAADAPESVQDARARALWANGAGCSHWAACG